MTRDTEKLLLAASREMKELNAGHLMITGRGEDGSGDEDSGPILFVALAINDQRRAEEIVELVRQWDEEDDASGTTST